MARVKITEFGVIQKLLAGATVEIFSASDSGENTGVLATLYKADTGADQVTNPQILDEDGKLPVDCYVDGIVMAEISNISDLSYRSLSRIKANPLEYPLGATNAAYEGISVIGSVADAEAAATQAGTYLGLIEDTFQGVPSTSNLSISSGSKTFTVAAGLPFGAGQYIIATSDANPTTHSMNGQITSYSGTSLIMTVNAFLGSGSRADWTIRNSGPQGATGATGPAGAGSGDMLKAENLSGLVNYATARSNLGLGTAAQAASTDFATAAQGALADTAVQPADIANIGAFVLLGTYTPSAAASVDITSKLSSAYDDYMIIGSDLSPSVDGANLQLLTSSNNGVAWDSAADSYAYGCGLGNGISGYGDFGSSSATLMQLTNSSSSTSNEGASLIIDLFNINSLSHKLLKWNGAYTSAAGSLYWESGAGKRKSTSAINALQLKFSSGTITGTVKIYGIKK